jgi:hypothetical protein
MAVEWDRNELIAPAIAIANELSRAHQAPVTSSSNVANAPV